MCACVVVAIEFFEHWMLEIVFAECVAGLFSCGYIWHTKQTGMCVLCVLCGVCFAVCVPVCVNVVCIVYV